MSTTWVRENELGYLVLKRLPETGMSFRDIYFGTLEQVRRCQTRDWPELSSIPNLLLLWTLTTVWMSESELDVVLKKFNKSALRTIQP